jgi:membrane protease YdiL (CAAX protease family)
MAVVDWDAAADIAVRMVPAGPTTTAPAAAQAVAELAELAAAAVQPVRETTGMVADVGEHRAAIVDRPEWIRSNVAGMRELLIPLEDRLDKSDTPSWLPSATGRISAIEFGLALSWVATKVLGQYEAVVAPGSSNRLLLVAPNIVAVERQMDVPSRDFRMWVALHEETHRVQFGAVPWLEAHFRSEIESLLLEMETAGSDALKRLAAAVVAVIKVLGGAPGATIIDAIQTPAQRWEIVLVLWLSLGAAAIRAALNLWNRLTSGQPLDDQTASIIAPVTPDRPWLDAGYQLSFLLLPLGAVALVGYLLYRSGESLATIGFDLRRPGSDLGRGVALAALVGGTGLLFYLAAYSAGLSVQIAAAAVSGWWDWLFLVLRAAENAVLEEVVILGFLLHRLDQIGMRPLPAIFLSSLLRGAYHLYQGFGGFIGNFAMGLLFGWLFRRWGRVGPMVVAHFLIDVVAFVGYALLSERISWLP